MPFWSQTGQMHLVGILDAVFLCGSRICYVFFSSSLKCFTYTHGCTVCIYINTVGHTIKEVISLSISKKKVTEFVCLISERQWMKERWRERERARETGRP